VTADGSHTEKETLLVREPLLTLTTSPDDATVFEVESCTPQPLSEKAFDADAVEQLGDCAGDACSEVVSSSSTVTEVISSVLVVPLKCAKLGSNDEAPRYEKRATASTAFTSIRPYAFEVASRESSITPVWESRNLLFPGLSSSLPTTCTADDFVPGPALEGTRNLRRNK
jgi:hypothetical protein